MRTLFILLLLLASTSAYAGLKCGGTEPFWSLLIESKKAVYENLEGKKTSYEISKGQDAAGLKPGFVKAYTLKSSKEVATAVVHNHKCSDGMSDIDYPYEVTLVQPNEVLFGCCR